MAVGVPVGVPVGIAGEASRTSGRSSMLVDCLASRFIEIIRLVHIYKNVTQVDIIKGYVKYLPTIQIIGAPMKSV